MEEQIQAVRRMQDFIEQHLYENITAADLANASGYSAWYANRLFNHWLNITPAEYIRKLRLSKSALRLRDEQIKIIDVAYEVGFNSVDGYQRAFHREFGCNPKEYAKSPTALYLFTPYGILSSKKREEKDMSEVKSIFIQVIEKTARKVIIKRGVKATHYFEYCEEVGCDVWGLLLSMKSMSGEPVCLWLPKKYVKPGTSEYVQGVEVDTEYDGEVPEGFDVIQLPACKYLMFQGEPFAEEDYEEAIEQIWKAEKKYDPSLIGFLWDMENPRIQLEPRGERGYIELLPVKEIHE
ncbi:MAG: AraC family transcriptional regulator [Lachnospiraceae bacterium]|nr:AraC family transcriptional regulator [Lachnospiraceae bacterium]MDD3617250.1 AraC family transcriptional regulator [Lachnospiraceae bacterium]